MHYVFNTFVIFINFPVKSIKFKELWTGASVGKSGMQIYLYYIKLVPFKSKIVWQIYQLGNTLLAKVVSVRSIYLCILSRYIHIGACIAQRTKCKQDACC